METSRQFGAWDYVVFALMLIVSAAIGVFYGCRGGKQRTTKEFLMADRNMSTIPVSISILVSFMSAILILGTPAEMYTAGTEYFILQFGMVVGCVIAAQVFVPLLYPLKLTSAFEYLELRFKSRAAKLVGTVILIISQILYMGIAAFAPSTALDAVTGFPVWATIIIVGLVSTFYTTLGGMKAVVWTDVFQAAIMIAGIVAIVIQGALEVGGMERVWKINYDWDRINFFDFDPNPAKRHSFWSLTIGPMVSWAGIYGVNQASVQRYCALTSLGRAKISIFLNIIGVVILITLTCLSGIVVFAYYVEQGCDPYTSKKIGNSNQLIPYFVMEVLNYPGLPGLFISCLFSGALSTMSSSLNAVAAVVWEDFLKPIIGHRLSESEKTLVTKLLVLIFGGAGIGMAFMAQGLGGTVLQASMSFTGAANGPLLGLFLLGGLFPWANGWGAAVGGIVGLILPLWISIGAYTLPPSGTHVTLLYPTNSCVAENVTSVAATTGATTLNATTFFTSTAALAAPKELSGIQLLYTVSYLWYPSIGAATVVVVGLIVSVITGPMSMDEVDPKYLIPLFDRLFCCLPSSWRRTLRCNRNFPKPEDLREKDVQEMEIKITIKEPQDSPPNGSEIAHDSPDGLEMAQSSSTGSKITQDSLNGLGIRIK